MANGVKLATGYVEITGDTAKVKEALEQSAKDAPAAGKKIGDELAKGIDAKAIGAKVSKDIETATDGRGVGQKIGRSVSEGIKNEISSVKTHFDTINKAANDTVNKVNGIVGSTQSAINSVQNTAGNIRKSFDETIGSVGRVKSSVGELGDAVRGLGSGDIPGSVGKLADSFTGTIDSIAAVQTSVTGIGDALKAIPGLSKMSAGAMIAEFGPVAVLLAAMAGDLWVLKQGWDKGKDRGHNVPGPGGGVLGSPGGEAIRGGAVPPGQQQLPPNANINTLGNTPPTPGPPPAGTSWQMGPDGNWVPVPLGQTLPGLGTAGGAGVAGSGAMTPAQQAGINAARGMVGAPYVYGGLDCSGSVSEVYSAMAGLPPGRKFSTISDFGSLGFKPGFKPGALNIGVVPLPGEQGHMAATLPDGSHFESSGSNGAQLGPAARGAADPMFQTHWYYEGPAATYDEGGILPPGMSLAVNASGKPELVLDPEQTRQHLGSGTPPGPPPGEAPPGPPPGGAPPGAQGQGGAEALDVARTMGLIPAGAGSKAVAGTSMIAGYLNLANEAVGGLIDAAASAAEQGIAMGANMGAPGSGSGAAAAASIPIGIAANEGKRAVSYGYQLVSIAADSLVDQIFGPFGGPPRWIGYDYSQFMPQINVGQIATTTVEKAFQAAAAAKQGQPVPPEQQPGGPVLPQMTPGAQAAAPPVPKFGEMPQTPMTPPPSGVPLEPSRPGQTAPPAEAAGPVAPPPAPPPPPASTSPAPTIQGPVNPLLELLMDVPKESVIPPPPPPPPKPPIMTPFDEGGWWPPGQPGINRTGRPELVLSPQQLDAMKTGSAPQGWGSGDTYHITAMDAVDVARQIDSRKQLAMMRYSVRP